MKSLTDREQAFEKKFAIDEEIQFKDASRRNRLLGLWAASLLGKEGSDAEDYAEEILRLSLESTSEQGVIDRVSADLGNKVGDSGVSIKMSELMAEVIAERIKSAA